MTRNDKVKRLQYIQGRLNEIWFSGSGPAGGDIQPQNKQEFSALLREEISLRKELEKRNDKGRSN